jgi:hypothetical protein
LVSLAALERLAIYLGGEVDFDGNLLCAQMYERRE